MALRFLESFERIRRLLVRLCVRPMAFLLPQMPFGWVVKWQRRRGFITTFANRTTKGIWLVGAWCVLRTLLRRFLTFALRLAPT